MFATHLAREVRRHGAAPPSRWIRTLALLLPALLAAEPAAAGIPEPDAIYYGSLSIDNVEQGPASGHVIELRRGAETLASYTMGSLPAVGGLYVLRVRLESTLGGAVSPGAAKLGDEATLLVNGVAAARLYIGSRGRVTRVNIAASSSAQNTPDFDGDGVPDFMDVCWLSASQIDSDNDGIGDACEGIVNPGLGYATVADDGNAADPATGRGAVAYAFEISDTEVTNADYLEFLQAVASADPAHLYSDAMASDPRGGIVRRGSAGGYTYKVKPNMANKPVNFVSWLDAARYANWRENGTPSGPQDANTTENGAFDLSVADPARSATLREQARNSIPTEDEWYKAAYYDPSSGGYSLYPTGHDIEPVWAEANGIGDVTNPGSNVANYDSLAVWGGQSGHLTSVASAAATSPSGTLDQGGNVAEWLADPAEGGQRVVRGGSYRDSRFALESVADSPDRSAVLRDPHYEGPDVGLRVLLVPEPDAALLSLAALWGLRLLRVRRRRSTAGDS